MFSGSATDTDDRHTFSYGTTVRKLEGMHNQIHRNPWLYRLERYRLYIASIPEREELSAFHTYLCSSPSIRQIMCIPLHTGIIVEIYKMCRGSDRPHAHQEDCSLHYPCANHPHYRYVAKHPNYKTHKFANLKTPCPQTSTLSSGKSQS